MLLFAASTIGGASKSVEEITTEVIVGMAFFCNFKISKTVTKHGEWHNHAVSFGHNTIL